MLVVLITGLGTGGFVLLQRSRLSQAQAEAAMAAVASRSARFWEVQAAVYRDDFAAGRLGEASYRRANEVARREILDAQAKLADAEKRQRRLERLARRPWTNPD